jgi:hypothetical protein
MASSLSHFFQAVPRYFFLFFIVFFTVTFFTFYESFRTYRAEAELLIIAKGGAVSSEGVAATIAHLPLTLSFYDRLLLDHENITDPWEGNMPIDRKDSWNGVIESSVLPETNVIRVAVSGPDSSQTGALLNASIETLYGFSGRLYDREREADIRRIDGVIVQPVLIHAWALFLISAFFATVLAFLVSLLFQTPLSSLRGVSFPAFPSLRAKMFSHRRETIVTETLRPVGAFPDISDGDSSSESVATSSGHLNESASLAPELKDQKEEMPAVPEEASLDIQKQEKEASKQEQPERKEEPERIETERGASFEPHDIWEKPRPLPIEKIRIQPVISDSPVLQANAPSDSDTISTLPRGNSVRSRESLPGNLSTVSAQDFTWEKFLFQSGEASKETKNDEKSVDVSAPHTPSPEKREPTPEELKARLNQLLRGEL